MVGALAGLIYGLLVVSGMASILFVSAFPLILSGLWMSARTASPYWKHFRFQLRITLIGAAGFLASAAVAAKHDPALGHTLFGLVRLIVPAMSVYGAIRLTKLQARTLRASEAPMD